MKVIGYTRVSTREQAEEGLSLGTQRAAIESYCEQRGWELVDVIEDDGYTGRTDDRPGLQRALTLLRRKRARAVVIARLDRLARSVVNLGQYIELSLRQKWSMVALDFNLDTTTAAGRLMVRLLASVAEWESEVNAERVSVGMREAYRLARASGTQPTFGFQRSTPEDVVRRIVHARDEAGLSFNAIALRLDEHGVPTPGNGARWYPSTVARIYKSATREAAA